MGLETCVDKSRFEEFFLNIASTVVSLSMDNNNNYGRPLGPRGPSSVSNPGSRRQSSAAQGVYPESPHGSAPGSVSGSAPGSASAFGPYPPGAPVGEAPLPNPLAHPLDPRRPSVPSSQLSVHSERPPRMSSRASSESLRSYQPPAHAPQTPRYDLQLDPSRMMTSSARMPDPEHVQIAYSPYGQPMGSYGQPAPMHHVGFAPLPIGMDMGMGMNLSHGLPQTQYQNQAQDHTQTQNQGQPGAATLRRKGTVKKVELKGGKLVVDIPVPDKVLSFGKFREGKEFTHLRYTAATCDPDQYANDGFTLRPAEMGRQTEMFVVMTMYVALFLIYHDFARFFSLCCQMRSSHAWHLGTTRTSTFSQSPFRRS